MLNAPVKIAGLPDHLASPPESPTAPDDPSREEKVAAYRDWARQLLQYRVERRAMLERVPSLIPIELRYCSDPDTGFLYWILMYGWIYEPRTNRRQSPDSPFILYRFQIDMLLWQMGMLDLDDAEGAEGDGVISKSRDMGATWCLCALALWGWLFMYPWQVRLISWRGDEVDANNTDSMFYKIRFMLVRLPAWQLPQGFLWDDNVHQGEIINPVNDNGLVGQTSTSRAMSGSRATWLIYDEGAKNKYLEESWSSTSNVAEHRTVSSSEHLEYNTFHHRLSHRIDIKPEEQPQVLELDYWLHPDHDDRWKQRQQARMASIPGSFEREVLRNPRANSPTIVYPLALSMQPEEIDYVWGSPVYVGIDPGSSDKCAVVWVQDNAGAQKMDVINAYARAKQVADWHGTMLRGTPYFIPPEDRWDFTEIEEALILQQNWGELEQLDGWTRCEDSDDWVYTPDDLEVCEWVRSISRPTMFYGDTSGQSVVGVTKDTVYTRLMKFGIIVNRDRMPSGEQTAFKRLARTYLGRQGALKEQLPRTRFANSPGGRMTLRAMQEYRWEKDADRPRVTEPTKPLHDDASHLCTCLEYIAVQRQIMRDITERVMPAATKARTGRRPGSTNYARMGRTPIGTR